MTTSWPCCSTPLPPSMQCVCHSCHSVPVELDVDRMCMGPRGPHEGRECNHKAGPMWMVRWSNCISGRGDTFSRQLQSGPSPTPHQSSDAHEGDSRACRPCAPVPGPHLALLSTSRHAVTPSCGPPREGASQWSLAPVSSGTASPAAVYSCAPSPCALLPACDFAPRQGPEVKAWHGGADAADSLER